MLNQKHLRIFISSPGDVSKERKIIETEIADFNHSVENVQQIFLEQVSWNDPKNNLILPAEITPQEAISRGLPKPSECDIVFFIFWGRMGTPLPFPKYTKPNGDPYFSGSEWEYENAVTGTNQNRPIVYVYKNETEILLNSKDPELGDKIKQTRALEIFFQRFNNSDGSINGVYHRYNTLKDFQKKLKRDIPILVQTVLEKKSHSVQTVLEKKSYSVQTENKPPQIENTKELVKPYLEWLIRQHNKLELRGIRETHPTIPLERVYVALKGDRTSSHERIQSQQMLESEILDNVRTLEGEFTLQELSEEFEKKRREILVKNPIMPSLLERDRISDEKLSDIVTLAEAFQEDRKLVILGDPGSGKTTLGRWLALKFARAFLNDEKEVHVPLEQVDPEIEKSDEYVSLGPIRLPVMLRVADYAVEYAKARKNNETLLLEDFLGKSGWMREFPTFENSRISDSKCNMMIKEYLKKGQVVVILDGMDEITNSADRDDIVRSIETFVNNWIDGKKTSMISKEHIHSQSQDLSTKPVDIGGNQIVITSRISGYYASPIKGDMIHVTIEPMKSVSVEHFCDSWTLAVNQTLFPKKKFSDLLSLSESESTKLKEAIYDSSKPRIRELASNPLLVTILAIVFRNRGNLPQHRSKLYRLAMEILIEDWRMVELSSDELVFVLSPLAAHIHQNYATGLIEENELKEIISENLASLRKVNSDDLSFNKSINHFLRVVREDVGLLAARGELIYGFLHLTFQEYLASLDLISSKEFAVKKIMKKLEDPRWIEPISLALGVIGTEWGPHAKEKFLLELLKEKDPLSDLIPRIPLLILNNLEEMNKIPVEIIQKSVKQLLKSYSDKEGLVTFSNLRKKIELTFSKLMDGEYRQTILELLKEELSDHTNENTSLATATLLSKQNNLDYSILTQLSKSVYLDSSEWDWPINRALLKIVSPQIPVFKPSKPTKKNNSDWKVLREQSPSQYYEERIRYLVSENMYEKLNKEYEKYQTRKTIDFNDRHLIFRTELKNVKLTNTIKSNSWWTRLVVSLYGGYSNHDSLNTLREYDEIAKFLQKYDAAREREISQNREYYVGRWGNDECIYSMAVYLDSKCQGKVNLVEKNPEFLPNYIFRESSITQDLVSGLEENISHKNLVTKLETKLQESTRDTSRIELIVALTSLGVNTLPIIKKEFETKYVNGLKIMDFFSLNKIILTDPITRSLYNEEFLKTIFKSIINFTDNQFIDITNQIIMLSHEFLNQPINPIKFVEMNNLSLIKQYYVKAEDFAYRLLGDASDDAAYNCATALDEMSKWTPEKTLQILFYLFKTKNSQWSNSLLTWKFGLMPTPSNNLDEVPMEILNFIENLPVERISQNLRGGLISSFLQSMVPWIEKHPNTVPELLVLASLFPSVTSFFVQKFAPALFKTNNPFTKILQMVNKITDPYYQSRTLLRLIHYLPLEKDNILRELTKTVFRIDDSNKRCTLLIYTLPICKSEDYSRIFSELERSIKLIESPSDQVLQLILFLKHTSGNQRMVIFNQLQKEILKIPQLDRGRVIFELQKYFNYDLTSKIELSNLANSINNEWDKNNCTFRSNKNILDTLDSFDHDTDKQLWNILAHYSIMHDMTEYFNYDEIKSSSKLSDGSKSLEQSLETSQRSFPIKLSYNLTSKLNEIIQLGSMDLENAFPLLANPDIESLPIIKSWKTNSDRFISNFAHLILAEENNTIEKQDLSHFSELLKTNNELTIARVSLIIHGPIIDAHIEHKTKFSSKLGLNFLYEIAREHAKHDNAKFSQIFSWFWHDVIFDDVEQIKSLIDEVNNDGEKSKEALSILNHIEVIDSEQDLDLIEQFLNSNSICQKALFLAMCRMAHLNKSDIEAQKLFDALYSHKDEEKFSEFMKIKILQDSSSKFISKIIESLDSEDTTFEMTKAKATEVFECWPISIHELISQNNPKVINTFGQMSYWNNEYDVDILKSADLVMQTPFLLEIMIEWLTTSLKEDLTNDKFLSIRTNLLNIIAECVPHNPSTFSNIADSTDLHYLLPQAAIHHDDFTGRASAIKLLSYYRNITTDILDAIQSALFDADRIRNAVLASVPNFRNITNELISSLFLILNDKSTLKSYMAGELISSIYRGGKINTSQRKEFLNHLAETIRNNRNSTRGIYYLHESLEELKIKHKSNLNEELYRILVQLVSAT